MLHIVIALHEIEYSVLGIGSKIYHLIVMELFYYCHVTLFREMKFFLNKFVHFFM